MAIIVGVSGKVNQLNRNYINLGNSVYSIRDSLNSQIYSITDRVEEMLKAQNSLTADYGTEMLAADLPSPSLSTPCPKPILPGMDYVLDLNNDGKQLTWPESASVDTDLHSWSF